MMSITLGSCYLFVLVAGVCWARSGAYQSKTAVSCSSPRPHQGRNGWSAQCHQLPWTEAEAAEVLGLWVGVIKQSNRSNIRQRR